MNAKSWKKVLSYTIIKNYAFIHTQKKKKKKKKSICILGKKIL